MITIKEITGASIKEHGRKKVITVDGVAVVVDKGAGYDTIVSALIKARYNDDRQSAVVANLATAGIIEDQIKALEYRSEFEEFAAWRRRVKDAVKELLSTDK